MLISNLPNHPKIHTFWHFHYSSKHKFCHFKIENKKQLPLAPPENYQKYHFYYEKRGDCLKLKWYFFSMFQPIVHQQEKLERKPIFCFFDKLGNIQLFIDFHPVSTLDAILFYKVVCSNCFRTGTGTDFQCSPPTYKYSYSARIYQIDYNKIQSKNRGYPFIFNGQSHGKKRI